MTESKVQPTQETIQIQIPLTQEMTKQFLIDPTIPIQAQLVLPQIPRNRPINIEQEVTIETITATNPEVCNKNLEPTTTAPFQGSSPYKSHIAVTTANIQPDTLSRQIPSTVVDNPQANNPIQTTVAVNVNSNAVVANTNSRVTEIDNNLKGDYFKWYQFLLVLNTILSLVFWILSFVFLNVAGILAGIVLLHGYGFGIWGFYKKSHICNQIFKQYLITNVILEIIIFITSIVYAIWVALAFSIILFILNLIALFIVFNKLNDLLREREKLTS